MGSQRIWTRLKQLSTHTCMRCASWVFVVVVVVLATPCSMCNLSSPTRDQTCVPCIRSSPASGAWRLNHYTAREVLLPGLTVLDLSPGPLRGDMVRTQGASWMTCCEDWPWKLRRQPGQRHKVHSGGRRWGRAICCDSMSPHRCTLTPSVPLPPLGCLLGVNRSLLSL